LEQEQEVRVERGGLAPRHLILRIGDHRTGRKARARAQQRRIVLKKCRKVNLYFSLIDFYQEKKLQKTTACTTGTFTYFICGHNRS
jgi:hypothetical protein